MLTALIWWVRWKFGCPEVTTEKLQEIREDSADNLVLVDTRSDPEFAVSRLPGAINVPFALCKEDEDILKSEILDKCTDDASVVCYCSVGYRSSIVAKKLTELRPGLKSCNLEGGIFKWANEGRPLCDPESNEIQKTPGVHPYNTIFGRALNSDLWRWSLLEGN